MISKKVVEEARKIRPDTNINFDTNGYLFETSLERVLNFTTSITNDLKAYHDEVHLALTGASSRPVLRNAEYIGRHAKYKRWEYRILVIPKINEEEIKPLTEFIADMDPSLPLCFLAFRPNFALENHPGADRHLMDKCVDMAKNSGLNNAYGSGHAGIPGTPHGVESEIGETYTAEGARLAGSYAFKAGCQTHPRGCASCSLNQACGIKTHIPKVVT